MSEIIYYTDKNFAQTVLNESWNYLIFQISEGTEEALNKKCEFILKCQKVQWKPLLLEYKDHIKIYTKFFYIKK